MSRFSFKSYDERGRLFHRPKADGGCIDNPAPDSNHKRPASDNGILNDASNARCV